jgi:3-phosphoshikimate 1-carboxyvinyltransferase
MTGPSERTHDPVDAVEVSPITLLRGELRLPGDKSISHRAAMLAALAQGQSVLSNFSSAADCSATLDCLSALDVSIARHGSSVTISGNGPSAFVAPSTVLQAQNSGTTMRLLAGILAGQPFSTRITGDESLLNRPMLRIAEPLRRMGAEIELQSDGCAPLRITGRRPLRALDYKMPIASAQLKSAVLLAGLFADGITTVHEPPGIQTRDHTERLLRQFGAQPETNGEAISISGGVGLHARDLSIPGDISSAAFFIAAAISLPGSNLVIRDVGLNPTRSAFLSTLQTLGAEIAILDEQVEGEEPVGCVHVHGVESTGPKRLEICGALVPAVIDELPLLGFLCASRGWEMELRDAGELRVKESDRIAATVRNLSRMGASIIERDDGWQIKQSPGRLRGAELSAFGDHRIAMSCAVVALSADGPSKIAGARTAVAVSLPEFWSLLERVAQ